MVTYCPLCNSANVYGRQVRGRSPRRLPALERVAAVTVAGEMVAVPYPALARDPVAEARVGGRPAVVFYDHRAASVLDRRRIARPARSGRRSHSAAASPEGRSTSRPGAWGPSPIARPARGGTQLAG